MLDDGKKPIASSGQVSVRSFLSHNLRSSISHAHNYPRLQNLTSPKPTIITPSFISGLSISQLSHQTMTRVILTHQISYQTTPFTSIHPNRNPTPEQQSHPGSSPETKSWAGAIMYMATMTFHHRSTDLQTQSPRNRHP